MIAAGAAYYDPLRYSEMPKYYRENGEPILAAFFQVAPMDNQGWFSLVVTLSI